MQTVLLKLILVLFTCSLAIAIPDLGDFIALIGACASSLLALGKRHFYRTKNFIVFVRIFDFYLQSSAKIRFAFYAKVRFILRKIDYFFEVYFSFFIQWLLRIRKRKGKMTKTVIIGVIVLGVTIVAVFESSFLEKVQFFTVLPKSGISCKTTFFERCAKIRFICRKSAYKK